MTSIFMYYTPWGPPHLLWWTVLRYSEGVHSRQLASSHQCLRSFLDCANHYRWFVEGFSKLTAPQEQCCPRSRRARLDQLLTPVAASALQKETTSPWSWNLSGWNGPWQWSFRSVWRASTAHLRLIIISWLTWRQVPGGNGAAMGGEAVCI